MTNVSHRHSPEACVHSQRLKWALSYPLPTAITGIPHSIRASGLLQSTFIFSNPFNHHQRHGLQVFPPSPPSFFWLHCAACRILVPDQGLNSCLQHRDHGIATTGRPGRSHNSHFLWHPKLLKSWKGN